MADVPKETTENYTGARPLKGDAFAANPIVLIWSDEHRAWWKPAGCGYTDDRDLAARFYLKDAWLATKHCGPEKRIMFESAVSSYPRMSLEAFYNEHKS